MGRFLKNTRIPTAGYGAVLPYGGTALRPTAPVDGDIRFNNDTNKVEVYYSSAWNSIAKVGQVTITKDTFTGDSVTTAFTMTKTYTAGEETRIIAVVGNVFQNPGVAFTVSGTTISFTSPPPFGQTIIVLHGFASTDPA
jgi:hypothetical protein